MKKKMTTTSDSTCLILAVALTFPIFTKFSMLKKR